MRMFCARINEKTKEKQSVKEHLENVSMLARENGEKVSLRSTAELIGLLHDMGKYTNQFNSYINYVSNNPNDKSLKGKIDHSTAGAKYIFDKYYKTTDPYQKLTAQIIALSIYSHHGGLRDSLDLNGADKFTERMMKDAKDFNYHEAIKNFSKEFVEADIEQLFIMAKEEVRAVFAKIISIFNEKKYPIFATGLLSKYLFSCVIDADRYDTYGFMVGKEIRERSKKSSHWEELANTLAYKLQEFPQVSNIDKLRSDISITCKKFAENKPGIYQLSVPTGGGKTLSSLRYALEHAKEFDKERIFYVIPFTTIIDQNANDIKQVLGKEDIILEHHSNILMDNVHEDYKLLTERWDSPIILTTMVQFLETLFGGGTQSVRRMHNLANSVIIFDEIQAIPIKCISMFNSALNFLSTICNATVILCTATQPLLSETKMPLMLESNANIITDIHEKFLQFKRVNLIDKRVIGGYNTESLKDFTLEKMGKVESLLVILNTKSSAKKLFAELKKENDNRQPSEKYYIYHLSTNMCPAHRMNRLKDIEIKLGKERVICVSTQLIEAGINISFECVVRSLAGLDSIAQAAGRCNRHGEKGRGNVYIINSNEEIVSKLADIKEGQRVTERVLDEYKENPGIFDNDLLSPKVMERYYKYYYENRSQEMDYKLPRLGNGKNMYDLLSQNAESLDAYIGKNGCKPDIVLRQAFKTAGDNFNVIDQNTKTVLVPYGEGKELINSINCCYNIGELNHYLKKAQRFSVNLFDLDIIRLQEMGALVGLKDNSILTLREGFYCQDVGVSLEKQKLDLCIF